MEIIELTSLDDIRIAPFCRLTEVELLNRLDPSSGLMIVESPKVILTALKAGYDPVAILCERRHITGDAAPIISRLDDHIPVFTGSRELLSKLTGYTLTRGVLCAMHRKPSPEMGSLLKDARRVCIIDGVCDTTNIGAIFRSAAALGIDAVLLTRGTCDPFNRRSVRVSMGSVFLVRWGWIENVSDVKDLGFKTVAMALRDDSRLLSDPVLREESKLAIVLGTEGDGLADHVIEECDYVVRIPMRHGVDSLNVAAASAVAFYALCGSSQEISSKAEEME